MLMIASGPQTENVDSMTMHMIVAPFILTRICVFFFMTMCLAMGSISALGHVDEFDELCFILVFGLMYTG